MSDDDELRARLRAADPASSLPPADPERVARLLEDVMSTELTTEYRETGTRNRGPLTWAVFSNGHSRCRRTSKRWGYAPDR